MQLLLLLNTGLVIFGGLIKRLLVDRSSTVGPLEDVWNDIFDVSPATVATALGKFSAKLTSHHSQECA